jgi:hypothetical protein
MMNKSLNAVGKRKSSASKFWIASVVFIFLFAVVLLVMSPSFHDKYFGMAKYESAAVGSLQKINALEHLYAAAHADKGFACQLPLLRPTSKKDDTYDPIVALLGGTWSGYKFAVASCVLEANGIATQYEITAIPIRPYATGVRAFCTDQSGKLFYDQEGSASQCLAARQSLPD